MERVCILVSYDIADPKRWRRVFKLCRTYGDHLHFSVFRVDLTPKSRAELVAALDAVIHHRDDRVLLVDVGPTRSERTQRSFQALGKPYVHPERHAIVL